MSHPMKIPETTAPIPPKTGIQTPFPALPIVNAPEQAQKSLAPTKGNIGDANIQELQKIKPQEKSAGQSLNRKNPPDNTEMVNASPDVSSFVKPESGGNPNAKNPNSSASGLYQFTNKTFNDMVARHGKETGITFADKNNPQAQATMARLYAQDNIKVLEPALGRMPTKGELYQAHVLGPTGAARLINANPNQEAIMLFPRNVLDANHGLFFSGKRPITVAELQNKLSSKVA